jgi:RimJ/RimL family protein N-acetyltransferase
MINGNKIRLRPVEREDLPRYVEWFADPEVIRYLETFLGYSIEQEKNWFEEMLKLPPEEQALAVDIPRRGGGWQHIGGTSLMHFQWRVRSAEYGIVIGDKRFWHKGYGTEITRTMLHHAFGTLNLNRVFLRVYAPNQWAMQAYERAGFIREGCMRAAEYREGAYEDVFLYSILRREWDAIHAARKEK